MTPDEFSGFLKFHSISQAHVARKHKISVSQVNNFVRGYSKSPRVKKILAHELQMPIDSIDWPEYNRYSRCNVTIINRKPLTVNGKA